MKRAILILCCLVALGCSDAHLEKVEIIYVGTDEETGNPDHYTIIEFPDGERRFRFRHWGEVGDTFMARRGTARHNDW